MKNTCETLEELGGTTVFAIGIVTAVIGLFMTVPGITALVQKWSNKDKTSQNHRKINSKNPQ